MPFNPHTDGDEPCINLTDFGGPNMSPISDERFEALHDRVTIIERQQAVNELAVKTIAADVSVIKANTSRIVWAVLLAILASVMAFIIRGGLNVPLV